MKLNFSEIFLLIGIVVLTVSFMFKWYQIATKKHTIQMSLTTWGVMFLGRFLWTIYGFVLGTKGGMIILIGQGLITLMTVPIIYYIIRNRKTKGEYNKEHFDTKLFVLRVIADLTVLSIISILVVFSRVHYNGYPEVNKWIIFMIGLIGASITAFALAPQTLKIVRCKNTKSMSLPLQVTFIIGNSLIIAYLIYQMATTGNVINYICSILFGTISTLMIVPIFIIKMNNVIKHKEKVH